MSSVRVPTPLRPYAGGLKTIEVEGATVGAVLHELTARYPELRGHLFDESGSLRAFVHVFLGDRDVRELNGDATPLTDSDQILIVPSIAGGMDRPSPVRQVDHSALRVNQAVIIALLGAAYIVNAPIAVAFVAAVMLLGSAVGRPGFLPVYALLRSTRRFRPDVIEDNPEPHRFAQSLGGLALVGSTAAFLGAATSLGWILSWIVIALAGLNLFGGYCLGCALYYWLARLGVPGFRRQPIPRS